jgi:serine/threonine protein kinase
VLRDRYVLESQLGSGGTAVVYRAVDLRRDGGAPEGRRVAVKMLRPGLRDRPEAIARLQREFRQAQAVAHPNVIRLHDLDCDRGAWFIVMELLSGGTLRSRLRSMAPSGLPQSEALAIALAIAGALAQAHARGISHGDVKPGNVYLPTSGAPRLLDFGVAPESPLAEVARPSEARPSAAATRAYASPEVLAGEEPLPGDDVFSLACVTYEMLTGVHPFGRQSRDVAARIAAAPPAIASLDASMAAALASALDLRRAARPTMMEFVAALRGERRAAVAPALEPIATRPRVETPSPVAVAPAEPRRSRVYGWSAAAAAIASALAIGFLIGRGEPDQRMDAAPVEPPHIDSVMPSVPAVQEAPPAALHGPPAATTAAAAPVPGTSAANAAEAAQPGLVSFDSPMMVVSTRAVVAAIPLRLFSRERREVQVTWRVIDGTARAGRDYGGPATGVEHFAEGNTFRILYVPILQDGRTTLDRSFDVELTGASKGTELGPTQRIQVTILGAV